MPTLLTIHASPRGEQSISRTLGDRYIHHWQAKHPDGTITERDVLKPAIPYMSTDWITGVFAPPNVERTPEMLSALALSQTLIDELIAADELLICTPMYNFSVPAALKSWIDYVVRFGLTYDRGAVGLLTDKPRPTRVLIAGRDPYDGPIGDDDQVTPVIARALRYMGMNDVRSLLAGGSLGVNTRQVTLEDHVAKYEDGIAALVA